MKYFPRTTKANLWILLFLSSTSVGTAAGPILVPEATLNQLLAGGILGTADNLFSFDQFALVDTQVGDLPDLVIEATSDGIATSLFFEFGEESRIFRDGEGYELTIEFLAHSLNTTQRLSSAQLDLSGGSLGTSGTGRVDLSETVDAFPLGSSIVLSVFNSGNEPSMLVDNSLLSGGSDWKVKFRIKADGGTGTGSAAVLTDFTASFGTALVPEPSGLLYLGIAALGLGIARFRYW